MAPQSIYPPGYEEFHWHMEEDELVLKLQSIVLKFGDLGQYEERDVLEQHTSLCVYLANERFIKHPSRKVKILVALCLAEALRIYAPDEPFSSEQMKDILTFFISQYEGLKNPEDTEFQKYFKLLRILALIGAFNACSGLADEENILCSLFQITFQALTEENAADVHAPLLKILSSLVSDDYVSLSTEVLMIILMNIMEPIKSTKIASYNLARELLVSCHVPLAPYIRSLFNDRKKKHVPLDHNKIYKVFDVVTELISIKSSSMLQDLLLQSKDTLKESKESLSLCDNRGLYSTREREEVIAKDNNYKLKEKHDIEKQFALKGDKVTLARIECPKKSCPQMSNVTSPLPLVEEKMNLADTDAVKVEDVLDTNTLSTSTTAKRNARKKPHHILLQSPTKSPPVPTSLPYDSKLPAKLQPKNLSLAFNSVKEQVPKIRRNKKFSEMEILTRAIKYIRELGSLEE